MENTKKQQYEMHKDFFDRCKFAIDNGFYMEAILMEYVAIESRLEILLGVAGLPCNKFLDNNIRKDINISHRIECANYIFKNSKVFDKTKLDKKYFEDLKKWVAKRNEYIHGLYKNEIVYSQRIANAKEFAIKGYEYCKVLYNEVKRVKRFYKIQPDYSDDFIKCKAGGCSIRQ